MYFSFWESLLKTPIVNNNLEQLKIENSHVYVNNFNSLLKNQFIPEELWYITLRLNNLTSPLKYDGHDPIIVLSSQVVNDIMVIFSEYKQKN